MRGILFLFSSLLLASGALGLGCGSLKTASVNGDGGASSSSSSGGSGNTSSSSGGNNNLSSSSGSGAGPYGALPSGYCCTQDSDCRFRHCEDVGGGNKMCLDGCRVQDSCTYDDAALVFTCDAPDRYTDGWCRPEPTFQCKPSGQYELGQKETGACCSPTGDGMAGQECKGGICIAIGDGPWVCAHACDKGSDCSGPTQCQQITETRSECIPANSPYTCE